MIIRPFYDPVNSPYGQTYVNMDKPNYAGCYDTAKAFVRQDYVINKINIEST